MSRLRKLETPVQKRDAMGPHQWAQLLRKALARAQATNDSRSNALQQALSGSAEKVLRKMSIICEEDINREFPGPTT